MQSDSDRWRHWALVLGLPLMTLGLAHAFFTPRFQTNDDVGMNLMAAGVMVSPSPSTHVLFMSSLIAGPLSGLYTEWPAVPWYFLFMQGVMLLAFCAIADAVLWRGPSFNRLLGLGGFLLFVGIPYFVSIQFTQVAAVATAASAVVWCARGSDRAWTIGSVALCIVLICLGAAIRNHACALVATLGAPLMGLEIVRRLCIDHYANADSTWRRPAVRSIGVLILATIVGGLCAGSQTLIDWCDADWRTFPVYNYHRGQFNDFRVVPYDARTKPIFDRVGWSKNDYDMLMTFFFPDTDVYSLDHFRTILASCPSQQSSAQSVDAAWPMLQYQIRSGLFTLLLAAMLMPMILLPPARMTWLQYLMTIAAFLAAWYYLLVVLNRCPPHVLYATMGLPSAVGLALAAARGGDAAVTWRATLIRLLALGLLAGWTWPSFVYLRAESKRAIVQDRTLREHLRALNPSPDQLYIVWGSSFQFEWIMPTRGLEPFRQFKMFPLGCATNTPITDARLREFGITDLISAIYERNDVFVICSEQMAKMLVTYIREHRGVDTSFARMPPETCFIVHRFSRISE